MPAAYANSQQKGATFQTKHPRSPSAKPEDAGICFTSRLWSCYSLPEQKKNIKVPSMNPSQGRDFLARLICQALRKHFPSERDALLYSISQSVLQEFRSNRVGCYRKSSKSFDDPRNEIRQRRERR